MAEMNVEVKSPVARRAPIMRDTSKDRREHAGVLPEEPMEGPQGVLTRLAIALSETYLRPAVARAVIPFIVHDAQDLNVNRVACKLCVSRWTLQRRARTGAGLRAKHLVALSRLFTALACLLHHAPAGNDRSYSTGRPLSRRERRVVRVLLGMQPAALRRVLAIEGTGGLKRLLIKRLGESVFCATV